jgi:hypothetical protein
LSSSAFIFIKSTSFSTGDDSVFSRLPFLSGSSSTLVAYFLPSRTTGAAAPSSFY